MNKFFALLLILLTGCALTNYQKSISSTEESFKTWSALRDKNPNYKILKAVEIGGDDYDIPPVECTVVNHKIQTNNDEETNRECSKSSIDELYSECLERILTLKIIDKSDYRVSFFPNGLIKSCHYKVNRWKNCDDCKLWVGFTLEQLKLTTSTP